jgi:hypothetical protein
MKKLFLIHCGFYDSQFADEALMATYESHVNFFVAADDVESARLAARELPDFKAKKMHVDGIQEVQAVGGHRVRLEADSQLDGRTVVVSNRNRELAPKKA